MCEEGYSQHFQWGLHSTFLFGFTFNISLCVGGFTFNIFIGVYIQHLLGGGYIQILCVRGCVLHSTFLFWFTFNIFVWVNIQHLFVGGGYIEHFYWGLHSNFVRELGLQSTFSVGVTFNIFVWVYIQHLFVEGEVTFMCEGVTVNIFMVGVSEHFCIVESYVLYLVRLVSNI